MMGRSDHIVYNKHHDLYLVKDDFGVCVLYDCTILDLGNLEQDLVRIGSYFINKTEP